MATRSERAGGAELDLGGGGGDGEVGDGGVLGLSQAAGDDGAVAVLAGQGQGVEGLGQGADLAGLDHDGVGGLAGRAQGDPVGPGGEEVVAGDLDLAAQAEGERGPAGPVVVAQGVSIEAIGYWRTQCSSIAIISAESNDCRPMSSR